MDFALIVGIFVLGAVSGALVMLAMVSDRLEPRTAEIHSYGDDLEQRARRLQ
ncbi:hypothetical protein IVB12_05335 [Bradyrhizobium sp. 179]|uniref:hypothetical protein n=1 Tax=Bradyrhizobium sp. 179 TaxID=2782648 RepID=UPI001FFA5B1A|nr:hypothetical protein [Bradyrhizobium sp. 179]MCK1541414.1 hypothetical protein [Bradyrhizobium sp. 179]